MDKMRRLGEIVRIHVRELSEAMRSDDALMVVTEITSSEEKFTRDLKGIVVEISEELEKAEIIDETEQK